MFMHSNMSSDAGPFAEDYLDRQISENKFLTGASNDLAGLFSSMRNFFQKFCFRFVIP